MVTYLYISMHFTFPSSKYSPPRTIKHIVEAPNALMATLSGAFNATQYNICFQIFFQRIQSSSQTFSKEIILFYS